jgi:hypothetical protein
MAEPRFFATPALWRDWLAAHHGKAEELTASGSDTGKASVTWRYRPCGGRLPPNGPRPGRGGWSS